MRTAEAVERAEAVSAGVHLIATAAAHYREARHEHRMREQRVRELVLAWSDRLSLQQLADASGLAVDVVEHLVADAGPAFKRLPALPPLPQPRQ